MQGGGRRCHVVSTLVVGIIWHHEWIAAVVDTIVYDAPLDCSPEVIYHYCAMSLYTVEQAHIETQLRHAKLEDNVNNNFNKLLQKLDAAWTKNTALREAYHASREETAALKAAVDALTKRINKTITTTMPPSPATMSPPHYDGGDDDATLSHTT
jgi:uncharacterized coiled-coil protein SlyX